MKKQKKATKKPELGKRDSLLKKILIFSPLFLSFLWIISLSARQKLVYLPEVGLRFSPIQNNGPLITGLVIFVCGYMLFICILYFEDIKEFFENIKKKK